MSNVAGVALNKYYLSYFLISWVFILHRQAPIGDDNYLMLTSAMGQHDHVIWDTGQSSLPPLGTANTAPAPAATKTGPDTLTPLADLRAHNKPGNTASHSAVPPNIQPANNSPIFTPVDETDDSNVKPVNNSTNLTINNIRDSIKKNANNNIKRLLNAKVNNTVRDEAEDPLQVNLNKVDEAGLVVPNVRLPADPSHANSSSEGIASQKNCIVSEASANSACGPDTTMSQSGCIGPALATRVTPALACCASPVITTSCITSATVRSQDLSVSKSGRSLLSYPHCDSHPMTADANKQSCNTDNPCSDGRQDTVEQCLGTIADAVKSSAQLLHKAERQMGTSEDDCKGFLLTKIALPKQDNIVERKTSAPFSRPFPEDYHSNPSPASTLGSRSTRRTLDSGRSSPDYVNITSLGHIEDEMEYDSQSSKQVYSLADQEPEQMEVCDSSPVAVEYNKKSKSKAPESVLFATGVDQSRRTVFQQLSPDHIESRYPFNSHVSSSQSSSCESSSGPVSVEALGATQSSSESDGCSSPGVRDTQDWRPPVLPNDTSQLIANVTHHQDTLDNRLNGNVQRFSIWSYRYLVSHHYFIDILNVFISLLL